MEELPAADVALTDLQAAESAADASAPTAIANDVAAAVVLTLDNEMATCMGSQRWQLWMITGKKAAARFSSILAFMTASPYSSWQMRPQPLQRTTAPS